MNISTDKPPSINAKSTNLKFDLAKIRKLFSPKPLFALNIPKTIYNLVKGLAITDNQIEKIVTSIITSALVASDKTVRDIMLLRSSVVAVELKQDLQDILDTVLTSGHSRFPVIDKENNIIGILYSKDLLVHLTVDGQTTNKVLQQSMLRECPIIPQSKSIMVLLDEFKTKKIHMAAVVDEYGNFEGIVTIEDVLEELVGEIHDEHDREKKELFMPTADDAFICSSQTALSEFNKKFSNQITDYTAETVGGAITEEMGRVPQVGEKVEISGWKFTVLRANERVIQKVKFAPVEPSTSDIE